MGNKKIQPEKKGFNMLPENVQEQISPKLAKEFKDGGLVEATNKLKAQGLKGGGKPRGTARGMGAAKRGGGYNI